MVGLQQISYEVYEDVDVVEVCAKVLSPSIDCPIQFPFNVTLSTVTLSTDDKAGNPFTHGLYGLYLMMDFFHSQYLVILVLNPASCSLRNVKQAAV